MNVKDVTADREREIEEIRHFSNLIRQIDCTAVVNQLYETKFKEHKPCSFHLSTAFVEAIQPPDVLDTPTMRAIHETIRPLAKDGWHKYLRRYLAELERERASGSEDICRLDEALVLVRKRFRLPPRDGSVAVTAGILAAHFWQMDWKNEFYFMHHSAITDSYYPTCTPGSIAEAAFENARSIRDERSRDRAVYFDMLDDGLPETDDGTHPSKEELKEMLAYLKERCAPRDGLDGDGI